MFDESNEPVRAGVTEDLDPSGPNPPADMDPPSRGFGPRYKTFFSVMSLSCLVKQTFFQCSLDSGCILVFFFHVIYSI